MKVNAFIQARMNSSRFPGKVLAPFNGQPLIRHVVASVNKAVDMDRIVVLTSVEPMDDPLAGYLTRCNVKIFRGSLENVFERFQNCAKANPCDYFFRISADSPLLPPELLEMAIGSISKNKRDADIVTNVFPRTFPHGFSIELLNSLTFLKIDKNSLAPEEREHATKKYYNCPDEFRIVRLLSNDPELGGKSLSVDELKDLRRMENTGEAEFEEYVEKMRPVKVCYE